MGWNQSTGRDNFTGMPSDPHATIAALATPPGEGGLAVIRVSGPDSLAVADRVFHCTPPPSSRPTHTVVHGPVLDAAGRPLDDALLLILRGPRSYTGEDTVEIQCHGGRQSAARILERLCGCGARPADPGEFTRRAFLNGKLDLAQAEAVLGLIRATSDRAASAAVDQLQGKLSRIINGLYDGIMAIMARLEAAIDFPEDISEEVDIKTMLPEIQAIQASIQSLADSWKEGRIIRDGLRVVILGRPNAGKSSLFNRLLGMPRAIVSEHPGTTRDTIEAEIQIGGYFLTFVDTAGLRHSDCKIEQEGVRRSMEQARLADLFIYLLDASAPPNDDDMKFLSPGPAIPGIVVLNKLDKPSADKFRKSMNVNVDCEISVSQNTGLERLVDIVLKRSEKLYGSSDQIHAVSLRHSGLLQDASKEILSSMGLIGENRPDFIIPACAHLRTGAECLGKITGRVYSEDLLDSIFGQFCIGK